MARGQCPDLFGEWIVPAEVVFGQALTKWVFPIGIDRAPMDKDCIFCRVVRGESPADFVYRGESVVIFKDIHPDAPVHLLVVPKRHIRSVNDLEEQDRGILAEMIIRAKDVARDLAISKSGYRLLFNVERGGGQLIFHLHMHMIGASANVVTVGMAEKAGYPISFMEYLKIAYPYDDHRGAVYGVATAGGDLTVTPRPKPPCPPRARGDCASQGTRSMEP